jgi:hypothetical protein
MLALAKSKIPTSKLAHRHQCQAACLDEAARLGTNSGEFPGQWVWPEIWRMP